MTGLATASLAIGHHERLATHVIDLRDAPPDHFVDHGAEDWRHLTWRSIGRPYRVEDWAPAREAWQREHGRPMPVHVGWQHFNRAFHRWFQTDVPDARRDGIRRLGTALRQFDGPGSARVARELLQLAAWNRVHRVEDAIWDPRGKRALFEGLDLRAPSILFLGAADGYEAMQLAAMYPGGDVVLVDYDDFCRTDRFGTFPDDYPFLGVDVATGHRRIWHRSEMPITFEVADIRDLRYGREFDLVVSIGLVEHFPDDHKHEVWDFHRRFLRPGGLCIVTTPRNQWRGRAFYRLMAEHMNFGYRELMDIRQLGLYAWEAGFEILRAGVIKAHNGIVCRPR